MFVSSRDEAREFFLQVRVKMLNGAPLEPLERLVGEVIAQHPEYHVVLDQPERARETEFDAVDGAENPFLHMGLHIALIEQLQTDRPSGIRKIYQQLLTREGRDHHGVEHRIMVCLASALQRASVTGSAPDERAYLDAVEALLG